jgi:glycosyltransferase involved in cell wall biosynthesis
VRKLIVLSHSPFLPDAIGGSERSMHALLSSLTRRGWSVEMVCQTHPERQRRGYAPPDDDLGYPCHRVPASRLFERIDERIAEFKPDAALAGVYSLSIFLLLHALARNVTGFYYPTVPERMIDKYGPLFRIPEGIHALANSEVTADALRAMNVAEIAIVRPLVELERYRVAGTRERRFITFVNPIPVKGVAVAREIARRMPDRAFLFVKAKWAMAQGESSSAALAHGLPNVSVWEAQDDMKRVYAVTDVLLFPSQWEEPAGRVVLEAQVNGIPVVASRVGGVGDQVGAGGVLIDRRDDVAAFVHALRSLENGAAYEAYSRLALENARRPELQPEFQVDRFVEYVERHLSSAPRFTGGAATRSDGAPA